MTPSPHRSLRCVSWLLVLLAAPFAGAAEPPPTRTMAEVLAASAPSDWRPLDPERTLYLDLAAGRVVIELAPEFAPRHVENIQALVRERYFDGLTINRVQDNFVVQWGDAFAEEAGKERPMRSAQRSLPAEFTRDAAGLAFVALPDGDVFAPEVGFAHGFPAARDLTAGRAWMTHCYGTLGVGRGNDADSGGGSELYVVIGHAPRQLDRNITTVGRVVQGMPLLTALPRGTGGLGFYERAEQRVPIRRIRLAADVPERERTELELLRTDTPTFTALVEARRNRQDEWYKVPAGHIDLCSVPLPARARKNPANEAILPPELPWKGASELLVVAADHPWVTPTEASDFRHTPSYEDTITWLRRLAAATPRVKLTSLGRSAEGRELWLVVASQEGASTPAELAANGRPTVFAQAGIHAGEIDGKDAGLMLLRDLALEGGALTGLLDHTNLLFLPMFNPDGHERVTPFGRINQRGPEATGWRTTARNLNLNRDYTKLDAPEMQALVRALGAWSPDLYLDLHVTDGADYQYDITYGWNGRHAASPAIATWLDEVLGPRLAKDLTTQGHIPGPLIQFVDGDDPTQGIVEWTAPPRFSHGYGDLRHLPSILVENHSLKAFRQRVLGTRVLLESVLRTVGQPAAATQLRQAISADRARRPDAVTLGWRPAATPVQIELRGVTWRRGESVVSGGPKIEWLGQPQTQTVPVVRLVDPAAKVQPPRAYWLSAAWGEVIERLRLHGLTLETIDQPVTLEVEVDVIASAELPRSTSGVFEGRVSITAVTQPERRTMTFPAGSVRVPTDQPLGELAVALLDPASGDSFFRWGFFLECLQRTEYAESYVMEPMAERMLAADPALRAEFEKRLAEDPAFAGSQQQRLDFFYRRTPFYDERSQVIPVMREVAR